MRADELKALFDQQAAGYDRQWARMAPVRDSLHLLLEAVFAPLPADARILCVGVGTGAEMAHLAKVFPRWRFTALDPSEAMIDVCRARAEADGFADRCRFHAGYLETLPEDTAFDGATCFLVSQFILDREARIEFFRGIAARLRPGGLLASSDLSWDTEATDYPTILRVWLQTMATAGLDDEAIERMRGNYARDVGILPPDAVAALIASAGFDAPVRFHQAGMIHAWFARRT